MLIINYRAEWFKERKKKKIRNQNHQQLICKNHHKWIAIIYRENPGIVTGVESGTEEVSGRAAVAEDNTGTRVFLVVLLGKRGRVCHKNQVALKTGRSVLWANIFLQSATLHRILLLLCILCRTAPTVPLTVLRSRSGSALLPSFFTQTLMSS